MSQASRLPRPITVKLDHVKGAHYELTNLQVRQMNESATSSGNNTDKMMGTKLRSCSGSFLPGRPTTPTDSVLSPARRSTAG